MGTTAYRGKGSKGRAVNGDRPLGAASCRRGQYIKTTCQPPPPPPHNPPHNLSTTPPKPLHRFIPYIVASSVCVVPGSGIFVYLGTVAGTLDSIFSGKSGAGRTAEILTLVISGVVLLIFTAYVTVSAKRALREAEAATDLDPGSDASDSTP